MIHIYTNTCMCVCKLMGEGATQCFVQSVGGHARGISNWLWFLGSGCCRGCFHKNWGFFYGRPSKEDPTMGDPPKKTVLFDLHIKARVVWQLPLGVKLVGLTSLEPKGFTAAKQHIP